MDRAERRRRTAAVVARRKEVMKWSDYPMMDATVGRCKKVHPFDCGCGKKGMCAEGKRIYAGPTRQEKRHRVGFEEDLDGRS